MQLIHNTDTTIHLDIIKNHRKHSKFGGVDNIQNHPFGNNSSKSAYPWVSGLGAWDSLFTIKSGVWEVVGSIPNRGNILGEFVPARITGKVFSVNLSF